MSLSKQLFDEEFRANTKLGIDESLLWWTRFGTGSKVDWLTQVCSVLPSDAWTNPKYKPLWERPEWDKVDIQDVLLPLCELDGDIATFLMKFKQRIKGCDKVIHKSLRQSAIANAWLLTFFELTEFPMLEGFDPKRTYSSQVVNAWIAYEWFFGRSISDLLGKVQFKGPLDPALLTLGDASLKECALWLAWSTGYRPDQTLNQVLKRCNGTKALLGHALDPKGAPWAKYLKNRSRFISATYEWQTDATPDTDWKSVMLVDDVESASDEEDDGYMPHACSIDVA